MRKVIYISFEDYQRYCAIARMYDIKVSSLIKIAVIQFFPYPVHVDRISDHFNTYVKKL